MSAAALLLLAATAAPAAAPAAPQTALQCPAIEGLTLAYVDLYPGTPGVTLDLTPDRTIERGSLTANIWQLIRVRDGILVKCGYGRSQAGPFDRVETIKLPDTAKTCRADYTKGASRGYLVLQKFSCE